MLRSWKLGRVFGIGVYLNWTLLLVPLVALVLTWRWKGIGDGLFAGAPAGVFAAAAVLCVFVCVLLHEFGHALMARHFGIPTRDITLYPIGGVARLERMSEKPWEEFWIAVAGPAVNVAIAAFLLPVVFLLLRAGFQPSTIEEIEDFGELFSLSGGFKLLVFLFSANLFLACFNMLPAFPMDGGRVFRAVLSSWLGHRRATEIAAAVGTVMVGLFILVGFGFFDNILDIEASPMLILVALFVFAAGQQELAMVRHRAAHPNAEPITLEPAGHYYALDPTVQPPEPNFSGFTWDQGAGIWIEWRDGRAIQACLTH